MEQASIVFHPCTDEVEGFLRSLEPIGALECAGRIGERRNHQSVPIGKHLVIETGTDAARPSCQQLAAHRSEAALSFRIAKLDGVEAIENGEVLPIPGRRHVVNLVEKPCVLRAKHVDNFDRVPDIELALDAFAVGVERCGEAPPSVVISHNSQLTLSSIRCA